MLDLIQITNDPAFARRCDALAGFRLFVDLERLGKAQRQAGHNTFISTHTVEDVGRIKRVLQHAQLMVRVNPLHPDSRQEVEAVLAQGADSLMLPMFSGAGQLSRFMDLVAGRVPVVALLETAEAMASLQEWIGVPGLAEVFVGLNDLHLALGQRFMFEPLAAGMVDQVARAAKQHGLRFGFGGIARMDEGLLPGHDVLAEHLRLGSSSVILSRTFNRSEWGDSFEAEVAAVRETEQRLSLRDAAQVQADAQRVAATIGRIASGTVRVA